MQPAIHFPPSRQVAINSEPDVWQNRLLDLFVVAANPFFGMFDTSAQFAAPRQAQGFTHSTNLNLIGQDKFFGGPGQPPTHEPQLNPIVTRAVPEFTAPNLLETTLAVVTANPFNPVLPENPQAVEFPVELRTWISSSLNVRFVFGVPCLHAVVVYVPGLQESSAYNPGIQGQSVHTPGLQEASEDCQ